MQKLPVFVDLVNKYKYDFLIAIDDENFNIAKAFEDIQMLPKSYLYREDGIFIENLLVKLIKID